MLKKLLYIVAFFSISVVVFGVFGLLAYRKIVSPLSDNKTPKSFTIQKGFSAATVGEKLEKEGFIRSNLVFKLYLKLTGKAKSVLPGSYQLSSNLSMTEIVDTLLRGPKDVWVLVPEGRRREEVAEILAQGLSKEGLLKDRFLEEFMEESKGKEGYLFPDTYLFAKEATASIVVKKMEQVFNSQTKNLQNDMVSGKTSSGLTWEEVVILASIIERETKIDAERPIVAGILLNRLRIGMALQTDATVQYAVANAKCLPAQAGQMLNAKCQSWWPVLTLEDLKTESPFNTYMRQGLPPSPIANPGISSIRAVIFPGENDYLYYLHDKGGKIHTAKTFEEHSKNISKFLK